MSTCSYIGLWRRRSPQSSAGQGSKLQGFEHLRQLVGIWTVDAHAVEIWSNRYIQRNRGQLLRQQGLLPKILEVLLLFSFQVGCRVQQDLHGTVFVQEFGGRLWTNARYAGNVVCAVPHEPQQINDLKRVINAKSLAHLGRTPYLRGVPRPTRSVHPHFVRDELCIVLVRRHHVDIEPLFLRHGRQTANGVVCFEARNGDSRNPQGPCHFMNPRHTGPNVLGRFVAVGLVFGIRLVPEGGARRIKDDGDVGGLFVAQDVQHGGGKAKYSAGILPFAVDSWIADERVIRPKNQGIGIEQKELLVGFFSQHGGTN